MLVSLLNNFCSKRVKLAGSFYMTFGIFGVINYPLSYLYYLIHNSADGYESLILRLTATILCFFLSIHKIWPRKIKKYLPLYWHFTLLFCLPFIGTYLLLCNNLSISWLMNMVLALFILILIVDWLSFIILLVMGVILGILLYVAMGGSLILVVKEEFLFIAIYMYLFAIIIGLVFSRNKELLEEEREHATETIKKLNEKLEYKVYERTLDLRKALETKTEFLNNMSHEIRTPVHGFTVISEGLVDHWEEFAEDARYKYITEIAKNAKRLETLLSGLLDMSKFAAHKMLMDYRKINLTELVNDIILECKELYLRYKFIDIKFDFAKKVLINANKNRIEQVLRNLLSNAIKFTPENGVIEVVIKLDEEYIELIIKDSGVGIPENELEVIFEMFVQSSKTKTNAGGTGIGLSIAKNIIELHNGKIWADVNDNGGASFHFTLPLIKE